MAKSDFKNQYRNKNIKEADILEAMKGSGGSINRTMANLNKILGTNYSWDTVANRIENSEKLSEFLLQERKTRSERIFDTAEDKFLEALEKNEQWAVRYALSTLGRTHGYDISQTVKVENKKALNIQFTGALLTAEQLSQSPEVEIWTPEPTAELPEPNNE